MNGEADRTIVWERAEARLEVSLHRARLRQDGTMRSVSATQLRDGALDEAIRERFDLATLAEARVTPVHLGAVVRHAELPRLPDRPSFRRVLGGGGGGTWVVWFWGGDVQVRLPGSSEDLRTSLAKIRDDGVPQVAVEGLPEHAVGTLTRMAATLSALPCMCGTGCETAEQHGSITPWGGRIQHPRAPYEHLASVGACAVCERVWTFVTQGDTRYELQCRAHPFAGVPL